MTWFILFLGTVLGYALALLTYVIIQRYYEWKFALYDTAYKAGYDKATRDYNIHIVTND